MNLKKNDCHKTYTSMLRKMFEYSLLFLFQLSISNHSFSSSIG